MRPRTATGVRGPTRSLGDIMKLGYFQQIRPLISNGIDVECRDTYRRTPLILCAFMEPEEWAVSTAMSLIEHGVNVGDRDIYGRNALHYACIYERTRLSRVLLRAIDFDLGQIDINGNTALHYAAMSGNLTICQLVAHNFSKYRINAAKVNRNGRTALEEALMAGNTICAQAIQIELTTGSQHVLLKDVRFADDLGLTSSSSCFGSLNGSRMSCSKRFMRPISAAVLERSRSSFSISSAASLRSTDSLLTRSNRRVRPSSGLMTSACYRNSQNPLYVGGYRQDDDIIYCAPEDDFRNKLDYVCKLVNMSYDPQIWDHVSMLGSAGQSNRFWLNTSTPRQTPKTGTDWRLELEQLFKVFEHQCSPSWRAVRKCEKPLQTPSPSPAPEDEDRGKKGKNSGGSSRSNQAKENSPEPKKRAQRQRKITLSNGKLPSVDGSLDTSTTDVANGGTTSKKREKERETSAGRSDSSASRLRPRSTKEVSPVSPTPLISSPSPKQESPVTGINQHPENGILSSTESKETKPSVKNSSKQSTINPATSPVQPSSSIVAQNGTQQDIVPLIEIPTSTEKDNNDVITSKPGSTSIVVPKIKVVADTRGSRNNSDSHQLVDTNKLWVQTPYDVGNDDDDDDNSGEVTSDYYVADDDEDSG